MWGNVLICRIQILFGSLDIMNGVKLHYTLGKQTWECMGESPPPLSFVENVFLYCIKCSNMFCGCIRLFSNIFLICLSLFTLFTETWSVFNINQYYLLLQQPAKWCLTFLGIVCSTMYRQKMPFYFEARQFNCLIRRSWTVKPAEHSQWQTNINWSRKVINLWWSQSLDGESH